VKQTAKVFNVWEKDEIMEVKRRAPVLSIKVLKRNRKREYDGKFYFALPYINIIKVQCS